jgi:Zinc finger, C2H2 type
MENDEKKCYNCGKLFRTPAELVRHKNRKTPCLIRDVSEIDKKNPNRCIYCNKILSKKENLTRHLTKCKIKNGGLQTLHDKVKHEEQLRILQEEFELKNKEFDVKNKEFELKNKKIEELLSAVMSNNDQLKAQMDAQAAEIKELRAGGKMIDNNHHNINGSNNNNNTTNNTINNNINITINNYNKPNVEHLKDLKSFSKMLNYELSGTPMALIDKIWYDPEHPENNAIHLVNKKTGETLVVINGKWITESASNIIPVIRQIVYEFTQNMIMKNFDVLINFGNDMVPRFLELNRKDDGSLKRETEEILQKMIDGRKVSQLCVDNK